MSFETYSRFRVTLILRCWEDPVFAERFRRDAPGAVASSLSPAEQGLPEAGEMEALCSMQIPDSPIVMEAGMDQEQLLFAFWEGVFETQ